MHRSALRGATIATAVLVAATCGTAAARVIPVSTYPELRDACQSALPGDTIVAAPGVYTITGASRIMITGRPGPVLVTGSTGDPRDVIVEGAGQDDESVQMIFNLDDSPRWTFRHLTTRRSYYHGFKFDHGSSDCVLRDVVMRDHGESGVKGTSDTAAGRYPDRLLVEHCDIGFTASSGGTRSVVEGIDGVGVDDWVIRNNRFVNIQKGGAEAYALFTKGNSSGTIVDGNLFIGCFIGTSFGGGGTAPEFFRDGDQRYEHRGGIVRNNVMIRTTDAGIYMNKALGCEIDNNTLFECELTIQLRFAATSGRLANNLVKPAPDNASEPLVRIRDGATLLEQQATLAATDADFVEPTGTDDQLDLHLSSGSRAVDAGVPPATPVTTDFDGRPRPSGAAIDVGAFEREGTSGVRAGTVDTTPALALREVTVDAWSVDIRSGTAWRLALYDLSGRLITSRAGAATTGSEVVVGRAGLSPGLYLLRLEPERGEPARTLMLPH